MLFCGHHEQPKSLLFKEIKVHCLKRIKSTFLKKPPVVMFSNYIQFFWYHTYKYFQQRDLSLYIFKVTVNLFLSNPAYKSNIQFNYTNLSYCYPVYFFKCPHTVDNLLISTFGSRWCRIINFKIKLKCFIAITIYIKLVAI